MFGKAELRVYLQPYGSEYYSEHSGCVVKTQKWHSQIIMCENTICLMFFYGISEESQDKLHKECRFHGQCLRKFHAWEPSRSRTTALLMTVALSFARSSLGHAVRKDTTGRGLPAAPDIMQQSGQAAAPHVQPTPSRA